VEENPIIMQCIKT